MAETNRPWLRSASTVDVSSGADKWITFMGNIPAEGVCLIKVLNCDSDIRCTGTRCRSCGVPGARGDFCSNTFATGRVAHSQYDGQEYRDYLKDLTGFTG